MDKEKRNIQTLATTQSKYLSDILDVEDVKQFKSLIPELKDVEIIEELVGLRPGRSSVRFL